MYTVSFLSYTVQLSQLSPPKFWVVTWPQADAGCLQGVCRVSVSWRTWTWAANCVSLDVYWLPWRPAMKLQGSRTATFSSHSTWPLNFRYTQVTCSGILDADLQCTLIWHEFDIFWHSIWIIWRAVPCCIWICCSARSAPKRHVTDNQNQPAPQMPAASGWGMSDLMRRWCQPMDALQPDAWCCWCCWCCCTWQKPTNFRLRLDASWAFGIYYNWILYYLAISSILIYFNLF